MRRDKKYSRRHFITVSAAAVAAFPILSNAMHVPSAFAEDKPLDLTNPTAVALGYNHDTKKVDLSTFPKRKEPADQSCLNCNFYSQGGKKIVGQEGNWGVCALFPGMGLVNEQGWCNSWVKKP